MLALEFSDYFPQYFTATILEWKPLLKPDKYKTIITDSLAFLVGDNRVKVYGFVIMMNYIHIIWQVKAGHKLQDVQHSFMKFTAQMIKMDLQKNHPKVLEHFYVGAKDRLFQIWERNGPVLRLKAIKCLIKSWSIFTKIR
ncbi:MAG: hypothetical protein ABIX01_18030 [Chitinophagaceae bacterium]